MDDLRITDDEVETYRLAQLWVRKHEGLRLFPYTDTVGKLTIGYGRNLVDRGLAITEAELMLQNDLHFAEVDARSFTGPAFETLSAPRRAVVVDMAFNLGLTRLRQFTRFREALGQGDFETAAREMLDSRWATQVGQRALTLADTMRTGK